MKLKSQIFISTDAQGNKINVEGRDIIIKLNGEKMPTRLFDIFKHLEFDTGEIYGNSLLSYYTPQEDGSLAVEGSIVQFVDAKTDELIMIKGFEKPSIHDDGPITFENIKLFAEYFKISKPEEVFKDLSSEEKQTFISAREAAVVQPVVEEVRVVDKEKEAAELQEKQQAEATLKASIDPQFVLDNGGYAAVQGFYSNVKSKEYIEVPYHLFHGPDPEQQPCILIKRGADWWEEIKPENLETLEKTDTTLVVGFKDGETPKKATLDIETGTLTVIDNIDPE